MPMNRGSSGAGPQPYALLYLRTSRISLAKCLRLFTMSSFRTADAFVAFDMYSGDTPRLVAWGSAAERAIDAVVCDQFG